jgi:hypothetical protein
VVFAEKAEADPVLMGQPSIVLHVLQGGTLSMAEIMGRMAEQKQGAVQAAERKLCERLNELAAALTAQADAADASRQALTHHACATRCSAGCCPVNRLANSKCPPSFVFEMSHVEQHDPNTFTCTTVL